jgi:hypothetical protein
MRELPPIVGVKGARHPANSMVDPDCYALLCAFIACLSHTPLLSADAKQLR